MDHLVGNVQQLLVMGDQDGDPPLGVGLQIRGQPLPALGVQSRGGLVQHQQLRVLVECLHDGHLLPLSPRQLVGVQLQQGVQVPGVHLALAEVHHLQKLFEPLFVPRAVLPVGDVEAHRAPEHHGLLLADPGVGRSHLIEVYVLKGHAVILHRGIPIGDVEPQQHIGQSGLARAVPARQAVDLILLEGLGQVFQHRLPLHIGEVQPLGRDGLQWGGHLAAVALLGDVGELLQPLVVGHTLLGVLADTDEVGHAGDDQGEEGVDDDELARGEPALKDGPAGVDHEDDGHNVAQLGLERTVGKNRFRIFGIGFFQVLGPLDVPAAQKVKEGAQPDGPHRPELLVQGGHKLVLSLGLCFGGLGDLTAVQLVHQKHHGNGGEGDEAAPQIQVKHKAQGDHKDQGHAGYHGAGAHQIADQAVDIGIDPAHQLGGVLSRQSPGGGLLEPLVDLLGHGGPTTHGHPGGHDLLDIGKQDVHQKDGQKEYAVVQEPVGGEGAPREPVQKQTQHIVGKGVVEADIENGGQQIQENDALELFQVGPGKANDGKK